MNLTLFTVLQVNVFTVFGENMALEKGAHAFMERHCKWREIYSLECLKLHKYVFLFSC